MQNRCVCVSLCVFGEVGKQKRGRLDRQEVCPAHTLQTHTKKHAPAHLFPVTGEERDGSPQDVPKGGGQVCCVSVCE